MFIEPLEDRIAPAAVVALTLTGTSLKVAFSSSQQLVIAPDVVSGIDVIGSSGATFTLNGSPLSGISGNPSAVSLSGHTIGSISIVDANPADTGDSITLAIPVHGNFGVTLAGTGNNVTVLSSQISGGLSVKTPAGGTSVTIAAPIGPNPTTLIGGPVKLALGLAGSLVSITAPSVEIDGSFSDVAGPTKMTGSPGPNTLTIGQSSGSQYLKVAGGFTFSSKFAPSHFLATIPTLSIGGNLTVIETGTTGSGGSEGLSGTSVNIGGNLSFSANSSQPINFMEQFISVAGKTTVVEGGTGAVTIQSTTGLQTGALAIKGNGGNLTLVGPITSMTSGPFDGLQIGGGVKLSGLNTVIFVATGVVGGNFSASNVSSLMIDFGLQPTSGHLAIGGSFSLAAPTPVNGGSVPSNSLQMGDTLVGGSMKVTGNAAGGTYALTDTSIFGSASFNIGPKVNAQGQLLTITETSGDHQMFIGGAFSASLGAGGAVTFSDQNSTPDLLVFGQATFTEPTINNLTLTLPSNLFALPIKIAKS